MGKGRGAVAINSDLRFNQGFREEITVCRSLVKVNPLSFKRDSYIWLV